MRLVRGAPGSGKTALVFREFKLALQEARYASRPAPRIIVPTATLVRHFQHELARDGVVFSPASIVSLNRFARERAPEIRLVPDALQRVIVGDCLDWLKLPEFSEVAHTEGMAATVIETIALFENAGCTPERLALVRRLTPHGKAFERLWRAVDAAIARAGYQTRAALFRAAAAVQTPGQVSLESICQARIWMDGFLAFSPLESELVRALAKTTDLTIAIADSPATDDIRRLALQLGASDKPLAGASRKPSATTLEARTLEREADEIARRILALHSEGTPFRQTGVALRDTAAYLPLLRTTFERFGIPARFYYGSPLRTHPAALLPGGLISGALSGWDFETTLETLRSHPRWGRSADFDRFDFAVREAMPGRGSEGLLSLCECGWLREEIARCLGIDEWLASSRTPSDWLARLGDFAHKLYRPGILADPRNHADIARERSQVAGLRAWLEAVGAVAAFWTDPGQAIPLQEFWRVAAVAVDSATVSCPDDRSDVVHVMSVYEARQWDLSALFVCGMVDRDFPKREPGNLLFPETDIERLNAAGIPLRKASSREKDELWLFQSLQTRARDWLFLSYPLHDASGKGAQPSRFLDARMAPQPAAPCRPQPRVERQAPALPGSIGSPGLLAEMARLHQTVSLTGLEDLAQCRFKFFAGRTLALKTAPESPAKRLSARVTGSILHEALERWLTDRSRGFTAVYEQTFEDTCRTKHLPPGYRLEVERIRFRRIAQKVSATEQWSSESPMAEVELTMDFPGGITVKCRIDRIDTFGDDCVIIDYKSSKTANVEKLAESATRLQGPLYALAVRERLNLNPVAVLYWAVRDDKRYGWGSIPGTGVTFREMPPNWATDARDRTVLRIADFLAGAVRAEPVEKASCLWCDFSGACRVEELTGPPGLVTLGAAVNG